MNWTTDKIRITAGLVSIFLFAYLLALAIGVFPSTAENDRHSARIKNCDCIAISISTLVNRNESQIIQRVLNSAVAQMSEIKSIAVVRSGGRPYVHTVGHEQFWNESHNSEQRHSILLESKQKNWGEIQFTFPQSADHQWIGILSPAIRFPLFMAAVLFVLYLICLGTIFSRITKDKSVPTRVHHALDNLTEGLMVLDRQGEIVLANRVFSDWVGIQSQDLLGTSLSESIGWKDEFGCDIEAYPWDESSQSGAVVDQILTLPKIRGAGETENSIEFGESNSLIFKVSCVPVMAESPKGNGVLVGLENVTELEFSKRAAKSANQAKSEFTANISHEKRTLKNAILGFTDWLRRGLASDPAEEQEYHSTIYSSGKHLRELINDVLDLSKIEADKMEISLVQFSPFSIIHDVENILRVRAEDKGIRLVTEYKNNFPELIYTDDVRLRQVVTNLVGNAIKFTSEGEVRIEAQMVLVDEIPMLRVSVIDSGIGMTEEQCRQIFDPFTPADSGVTRKFGGASLGLAICKKIVEALQGQIRVESELGQGSRFTFDVQVGEIFDVKWLNQEAYFESLKRQRSTHCNSITQLPPGRVLVVDDGLANRRLIRVILERAGCEVLEAVNGQEAVEIASAQQFDMVFMDMQMPILDGYKATVKLIENGLEAPVIALTANEIKGDQEKWQAAGCRGFIAKPVNIDILLATAAELLSSIPVGESKLEQAMERPWDQIEFRALFLEFMIPIQDCWENGDWEGLASSTSKFEQELVPFQKDSLAKVTGELNLICQGLMVCDPAEIVLTDVNNKMDDFLREAMAALKSSKELSRARTEMPTLVVSEPVHRETASSEFELGPIVSELPADDVEFVEIIVEFSSTLNQKLKEMDQLLQDSDFEGLSRLAHWLKGAGGTCGYREFYEPAADLEMFARDQQSIEAENALCQLHQLKGRIQLPDIASH